MSGVVAYKGNALPDIFYVEGSIIAGYTPMIFSFPSNLDPSIDGCLVACAVATAHTAFLDRSCTARLTNAFPITCRKQLFGLLLKAGFTSLTCQLHSMPGRDCTRCIPERPPTGAPKGTKLYSLLLFVLSPNLELFLAVQSLGRTHPSHESPWVWGLAIESCS